MASSRPDLRKLFRVLVVGLFAVLAVGFAASPAQAHATLEGTDPTPGSIADAAPTAITLNFSEHVQPVDDHIKVIAPDGSNVIKGSVFTTNNGSRVRIPVRGGLKNGSYLVSYRVISADGHPVSGSTTFSIGAPSALGASRDSAGSGETVDPVVRGVQSVGRYLAYAGIALLAGPLVILVGLWPRRLRASGPRKLAWIGWGLLVAGTLDVLVLQQPYADGNKIDVVTLGGLGETIDSTVGAALVARLGLLVAAVPVMLRVLRSADPERDEAAAWSGRVDRILTGVLALGVLVTFPFAGHGGQSPAPYVSVPAITLHVGAMAIWLGGLAVLARYLLPRARYRELEVIMPVWSRWAFWSVAVLVFSGTVETLLEIGGFTHLDYLVDTTYGQLVLTKVIWLGAIMVVAANARSWVRQRFGAVAYALAADERSDEPGQAPAPGPARAAAKKTASKAAAKAAAGAGGGGKAATATAPAPEEGPPVGPAPAPARKKPPKAGDAHERADFSAAGKAGPEVRRLRTRVAIEVVLGAVVLGLATALVQVAPARNAGEAAAAAKNLPFSAQLTMSKDVILQVDISPTRTGTNEVHLTTYDSTGLPAKVAEWKVDAELPAENLTSEVSVLPITDDHAIGQVDLPYPGAWKFTFTVRVSDFDEYSSVRTVNVR